VTIEKWRSAVNKFGHKSLSARMHIQQCIAHLYSHYLTVQSYDFPWTVTWRLVPWRHLVAVDQVSLPIYCLHSLLEINKTHKNIILHYLLIVIPCAFSLLILKSLRILKHSLHTRTLYWFGLNNFYFFLFFWNRNE